MNLPLFDVHMANEGTFSDKCVQVSELIKLHQQLCDEARTIMRDKNHDYRGGTEDPYANFRGATFLGVSPILGILLRMQDKIQRIKTFDEKGELKAHNESLKDAVIDVINYAVLIYGMANDKR